MEQSTTIDKLFSKNNEIMFMQVVEKILKQHFDIRSEVSSSKMQNAQRYDFLTSNGINFEVKYSIQDNILNIAQYFRNILAHYTGDVFEKTIIITNLVYKDAFAGPFKNGFGKYLKIISLENLLYLCKDNEELKTELLTFVRYSTEDLYLYR